MISEITRLVRRLDCPKVSKAGGALVPALVTAEKSRNAAVADWFVLWLETAKPK
jgi:hypothetical protein